MSTSRRSLIAAAAGALALPGEALALDWPSRRARPSKGCPGRVAYGGAPLHAGVDPAQLVEAARIGAIRATPFASDTLDQRLEKAAAGASSLTAAIGRADGTLWTQTLTAKGPAPSPASFAWPGLAQVYVATAVLQLVEEGKLSLEATVERWAPGVPTARWITVEDLLGHTSGLTPPPAGHPGYCPGAGFGQTEADYRLLGQIVEAFDGRPAREAVTRRTVEALELKETTLPAPADPAATVTASAGDVVRFWRAVMSGGLHSAEMTRHRFLRLYPMTAAPTRTWWGLGVMVSDLAADASNPPDTWLGHSQGAAAVAYSPRRRAFAAVSLTGHVSPDSVIDLMMLGVQPEPKAFSFTPTPPRKSRRAPRRPPAPRKAKPKP